MHEHSHAHSSHAAPPPDAVRAGRLSLGIGALPRLMIWVAACAGLWLAVLWAGLHTP